MKSNAMSQTITARQISILVRDVMIGIGLLTLARDTVGQAGQAGWFAVIIGGLFPLLGIWGAVSLCRRFPRQDFLFICRTLLGSVAGSCLAALYCIYHLVLGSLIARGFVEVVSTFFLVRTPRIVIMLLLFAGAAYLVQHGALALARVNELLFYILLVLPFLALPALHMADTTNLLPLWGRHLSGLGAGALSSAFAYTGFGVMLFLYWRADDPEKVLPRTLAATAYVILMYSFVVLMSTLVFGMDLLKRFTWPTLALLRTFTIPVLERIDSIFSIIWISVVYRVVSINHFAVCDTIASFWQRRWHHVIAWLAILPAIWIGTLPRNYGTLALWIRAVSLAGIGLELVVPWLLFVLTYIRRPKERSADG